MLLRLSIILVAAAALAAGSGDTDKAKLSEEEQRVLDLTNEARKKEGLQPLKVNAVLTKTARAHSENMAKQRKLDHKLDDMNPAQRVEKAGYKFFGVGENIYMSKRINAEAPDLAMKTWLDSKPHRENILQKEFTEIGIGVATNDSGEIYFTQVFGKPRK